MTKKVTEAGSISRRRLLTTASAGAALAASPLGINLLQAEGAPIRIGGGWTSLGRGGLRSSSGEVWSPDSVRRSLAARRRRNRSSM